MAPRTDRLACMVVLSALALLLAASPAHGQGILQDAVAAAGDSGAEAAGYKQSTGGLALSKYDAATKRYLPVATDPLYSYYRINITFQILSTDVFDPDPSTPTLFQSVASGLVFDNPSGAKVGSFDITSISTGVSAVGNRNTTSYLSYGVLELGPQGDDAIMFQGSTNLIRRTPTTERAYGDEDKAFVGGTGQFLGCSGQSLEEYATAWDAQGKALGVYEIIVPRVKSF